MNERIRELAEQSGFQMSQVFGPMAGPYPIKESLEKFAELIVHETMRVVANNVAWNSYLNAAEAVIQHFGVE
jgi:hypothetical protein